jgi:TRAP-type C4-dicarboxylate transport system permease small subunit
MSFWVKLGQLITKTAALLAISALLFMMGVVAINVIGRGFFSSPLLGTVELVGLAGVFLISFAIGLTERDRAHITVMIMVSRLPERVQSLFAIAGFFVCLVAVILLAWGGVLQIMDAIIRPEMVTFVLRVPKAPFISVWVVGCLFLFGFLLKNLVEELVRIRKK